MKGARGYTVMEVMTAMAVLAVGAAGIGALQKVTIIGNRNARTLSAANTIAMTWVERLRTDAARWTAPGVPPATTLWLKNVETGWLVPTGGEATFLGSPKADVLGTDIFDGDTSATAYCTHVRLTWMGDIVVTNPNLIRAEVRVFWSRQGDPITDVECDDVVNSAPPNPRFGYVVFTSGIMRTVVE